MEYDGRAYVRQIDVLQGKNRRLGNLKIPEEFLSGIVEGTKLKPVITIVFYLDKKPYKGGTELHDMLEWNKDYHMKRSDAWTALHFKPYVR